MAPFAVNAGVNVVEHPVEDAEVDAFDHAHVVEFDVQAMLLHLLELAAVVAGEAEGDQAVAIGPIDGFENVGAVAGAADGEEQVALGPVIHELLDENLVVAAVVADSEQPAGIVGQAEDLEPLFGFIIEIVGPQGALAKILSHMAGGGSAATVADDEDEAAVLPGIVNQVGPFLDVWLAQAGDLAIEALDIGREIEGGTKHGAEGTGDRGHETVDGLQYCVLSTQY